MAPPAAPARRPRALTVLVVDDDAMTRRLIQRILAEAGYTVYAAGSVPDARRLLPSIEHHLDLVLADVVMPGGLGPELVADLRIACPTARVAYISSYTAEKLKAHGVQLNGAELLQKPFMPAQLLERVKELTVRR